MRCYAYTSLRARRGKGWWSAQWIEQVAAGEGVNEAVVGCESEADLHTAAVADIPPRSHTGRAQDELLKELGLPRNPGGWWRHLIPSSTAKTFKSTLGACGAIDDSKDFAALASAGDVALEETDVFVCILDLARYTTSLRPNLVALRKHSTQYDRLLRVHTNEDQSTPQIRGNKADSCKADDQLHNADGMWAWIECDMVDGEEDDNDWAQIVKSIPGPFGHGRGVHRKLAGLPLALEDTTVTEGRSCSLSKGIRVKGNSKIRVDDLEGSGPLVKWTRACARLGVLAEYYSPASVLAMYSVASSYENVLCPIPMYPIMVARLDNLERRVHKHTHACFA
uniref:Uncharacterized protein n=1 Tax=Mycena chlorophos TaxID=658473 RepID=A0ABQ0L7A7_MYCCL|nr:predicted protein [Mycena chlorophos]